MTNHKAGPAPRDLATLLEKTLQRRQRDRLHRHRAQRDGRQTKFPFGWSGDDR